MISWLTESLCMFYDVSIFRTLVELLSSWCKYNTIQDILYIIERMCPSCVELYYYASELLLTHIFLIIVLVVVPDDKASYSKESNKNYVVI